MLPHWDSEVSQEPTAQVKLEFGLTGLVLLLLLPVHLLVLSVNQPSFYSLYAVALFALMAFCAYMLWKKAGWVLASAFLVGVCFQNLFLGWLLNFQQEPELIPMLALVEIKTVILFAGFVVVLAYALLHRTQANYKTDWGTLCGIGFVIVVMLGYWLSPAPIFAKFAQIRNFLTPVAAWYVGKICIRVERDFRRILGVMLAVGVVLSLFSVIELLNKNFWIDYLQMRTLQELKGPTAYQTDFLGVLVDRLFTGVGSPINASFIIALLFLLALYLDRRFLAGVFGLETLLTFTKAGIMVAVAGVGVFLLRERLRKTKNWTGALWTVPVVLVLLGLYLGASGADLADVMDISAAGMSNSAVGHLRGLIGAIVQIPEAPLGHGVGVSGNMSEVGTFVGATSEADSDYEHRYEIGGESTIGTILYQLGVVGMIAIAIWCVYRLRELFGIFQRLQVPSPWYSRSALAAMAALLGVLMSSFGSESAMVPQTGGLVFLVGGLVSGLNSAAFSQMKLRSVQ